jgi:hypothetical protein
MMLASHLSFMLVGRRHRPSQRDAELGRAQRVVLVMTDQRVERVKVDLQKAEKMLGLLKKISPKTWR